jgi:hypothetical protein
MTVSTIRRYEDEDKARVESAAERFCQRHNIKFERGYVTAEQAIENAIWQAHPQDTAYLRKLWTGCYCRALRVPYDVRATTASGYIGVTVE